MAEIHDTDISGEAAFVKSCHCERYRRHSLLWHLMVKPLDHSQSHHLIELPRYGAVHVDGITYIVIATVDIVGTTVFFRLLRRRAFYVVATVIFYTLSLCCWIAMGICGSTHLAQESLDFYTYSGTVKSFVFACIAALIFVFCNW